mmetsp:Transcript_36616/g.35410  ORF Transcript_36616/g.35410 Transcript_36616/m.35410 type:complete len:111 (-) Transcript_36616:471-803(-)
MHFLLFEDIYELHLLLEGLKELIPLALQLPIVLQDPVQVLLQPIILAQLISLSILQHHFVLFYLFQGPIDLRFLLILVLARLLLVPFPMFNLLILVLEHPFHLLELSLSL